MRTHAQTLVAGLAACALAPAASAQVERPEQIQYPPVPAFDIPRPERVELANGMIVYLLEDSELPLVNVQVRIRTGSRFDPPDKIGLADLTASVVRTGGAGSRTGEEIDQYLEDRAANLSTSVGIGVGFAQLSVLKEHLADAMSVLADILRSPRFEEDRLEEAKVQWRSSIARRNDGPGQIASREFSKLVYGATSPYARHTEYATVNAVTRDDLVAFHGEFYHPSILMGVTGDIKRDDMLALIEEHFGDWAQSTMAMAEMETAIQPADPNKVYYIEKTDITQANFRLGHLGTTVNDPDYSAVEVMNTIFGQGFASRLFNVIRSEKGLAYAIRGGVGASYAYPGTFQVSGETKLESTSETLQAIMYEIERMKEGTVSQEELEYAKASYLNSFIFNFDTPQEVVSRQMLYEYYRYPADFLQTFRQRIDAVTREDIRRVAQRLLTPDQLIVLVVGDQAKFDAALSQFGEVETIDISIPEGR